ncbi:MAG: acyl-CoA dehydrogenase family protein [Desulfobacteraceae bacterium]|nr:acyl-CoA dehydrogenase family protein [Desulfobacteraceae bacterium]
MKTFFNKGIILNKEEQMILKTVRELCRKQIAPKAAEIDEQEIFPWENMEKINEIGLNSLFIPQEYGGDLISKTAWLLILKEISKACASTGIIFATTSHGCHPIVQFGTEEQKKKFLPRFIDGALGGISITEADAGSDANAMTTVAEKTDDGYVLNGTKIFVSTGDVADILTVFAKVKHNNEILGLSPFIITKDMAGFASGKKEKKMGLRASSTAEITFNNCHVPDDHMLGNPGDGFKILLHALNYSRPNIAAQAAGIAEAAFDEAVAYANQRVQFGKPIIKHQGVQFMIAQMATRIQAAWRMILHVADLMDKGEDFSAEASMAKFFASETAESVASDAVQIHGGYGYCREYPVERIYRDSKITQIYEGTSQIQKIVIGRYFTGKKKW